MKDIVSTIAAFLMLGLAGAIVWFVLGMWIRKRWPALIPDELSFDHTIRTNQSLRAVAEHLAQTFPHELDPLVVCLGPVRGNAGRVLFHVGPKNRGKNTNIHNADYLLCVRRVNKRAVVLQLDTNRPHRHLFLREGEVRRLLDVVTSAYGGIEFL